MRVSNLSARLMVNNWLKRTGREPLSSDITYEEFANELRKITARKNTQFVFGGRADAVAYIRRVASSIKN